MDETNIADFLVDDFPFRFTTTNDTSAPSFIGIKILSFMAYLRL